MRNQLEVRATLVADEFIDTYMAAANGEYVKVYLYMLRHRGEEVNLASIADALNHTEADVRRALAYWKKMGVLSDGEENRTSRENLASGENLASRESRASRETAASKGASLPETPAAMEEQGERPSDGKAHVDRLHGDGEFSQLLYVAGQYMGRLLKPQDADMLAYLYDGLHMPCDVIEYVIEYCVQNRHNSIRYMEKVALSWHEKGIDTVEKAKAWTEHFNQDAFAVMKAFGINDRRPGNTEWDAIERWYKVWGFSRQLVVEACNRTMEAIHKPSFQYADRILEEWNRSGVHTMEDVEKADGKRRKPAQPEARRRGGNQFRNFEERKTDYDAMILEQWQ